MLFKDWKYYLIATLIVAAQYALPAITHSVILITYVLVSLASTRFVVNKKIFFLITPFIFLLPIGLINAWQWRSNDILRDCWYVINPMIVLLAGWLFSESIKGDLALIFKAIVVSAISFSCFHFYEIYRMLPELYGGWFGVRNLNTLTRTGSILSVLALSVLLFSGIDQFIKWRIQVKIFIFLTCAGSFVLSFSRSWLMAMIILLLFLLLIKVKKGKSFLMAAVFLSTIIVSFILIIFLPDQMECMGFLCNITESIQEMLPRDYFFMQDINRYWRGYETYTAIQQYINGSIFELFFGQGQGALIDLKITIRLGGFADESDKVPILHNGYVYLLVKYGFVGLILYVTQCFKFVMFGLKHFNDKIYARRLLGGYIVGLTAIIVALTFANSGVFNKYSMVPVLFFLAAFIRSQLYLDENPVTY